MGETDVKPNQIPEKEHPTLGKLKDNLGQITLVTPPSFFQNQNRSFCLVNLSKKDKDRFADELNKYMPKEDVTIYLCGEFHEKASVRNFLFISLKMYGFKKLPLSHSLVVIPVTIFYLKYFVLGRNTMVYQHRNHPTNE